MSFLGNKIKLIISIAQMAKDESDNKILSAVSNEIIDLKNLMEKRLNDLQNADNLRVYDQDGGILRGPIRSRKRFKLKHKLLCHERFMTKGSGKTSSEVPYMRALFNDRVMDGYDIIAYETPLLRKKRERKDGRALSCDLLGFKNKELCCIEVKIVPDNAATNLPYALLEGFSYAACLDWLIRNHSHEINQELSLCCNSFGFPIPSTVVDKATFAIAAPKIDYFKAYAIKKFKNHSLEWFKRRIKETIIIEKAITQQFKGCFHGYMVISSSVSDCKHRPSNKVGDVEPFFSGSNFITYYSSTNDLLKGVI